MQEFSPKTLKRIWQYRKWYFLIPATVFFIVAVVVAIKLPPVYESRATILIEDQQIPPEFVRSTVTGYADQHVQILTQQILSRTKLWEIIQKFNLYAQEREKYTKEAILDRMRQDIVFQTISADTRDSRGRRGGGSEKSFTIAFAIAYRGYDPAVVQKVTATLSSLYLEENLKYREEKAQTTTKFIEAELNQLREQIEFLGNKITEFKAKHPTTLPEMQAFNQSQAVSLENELRRLDSDIQAAADQRIFLQSLLGTQSELAAGMADQKNPRMRYQAVVEELEKLRAKYSGDHPDIQRLLKEKAQLEISLKSRKGGDLRSQMRLSQLQTELAALQGRYAEDHPDVKKLKNEIALLQSEAQKGNTMAQDMDLANPTQINIVMQIQQLSQRIDNLTQLRAKNQAKLAEFRQRLETTPKIEQEYFALIRDYQNAQAKYHEVMNKLLEARISEGMEQHQKGQKFSIIDPASFPEEPVQPNRWLIVAIGLLGGLGVGAAAVLGRESLDKSIKDLDELTDVIKTLPLGVIQSITTAYDRAQQRRRRLLVLATTGLSIVVGIIIFHFFYMDLYIFWSKLLRLADRL